MPIYEYECTNCGHRMEVLQKLSEKPLTDCPECEQAGLRKLLSAPQFRLAGGGWYETDFKGDKDKRRNLAGERKAEAGSGTDAGSGKDGKKKEGGASGSSDKAASKPSSGPGTGD